MEVTSVVVSDLFYVGDGFSPRKEAVITFNYDPEIIQDLYGLNTFDLEEQLAEIYGKKLIRALVDYKVCTTEK